MREPTEEIVMVWIKIATRESTSNYSVVVTPVRRVHGMSENAALVFKRVRSGNGMSV